MQKSKGSRSKIVKKSCYLRVKPGIPVPVDVVPVPDPTREKSTRTRPIPAGTGRVGYTCGYGLDPHTSTRQPMQLEKTWSDVLPWTQLEDQAFSRGSATPLPTPLRHVLPRQLWQFCDKGYTHQ